MARLHRFSRAEVMLLHALRNDCIPHFAYRSLFARKIRPLLLLFDEYSKTWFMLTGQLNNVPKERTSVALPVPRNR